MINKAIKSSAVNGKFQPQVGAAARFYSLELYFRIVMQNSCGFSMK